MTDSYALARLFVSLELGNSVFDDTRSSITAMKSWKPFIRTVERHGLAEIVLRISKQHSFSLPRSVISKLSALVLRHKASAKARYKVAQTLFDDLRDKNLKFVALKGTALTPMIYGHEASRPMRDIDILVRKEQRAEIVKSIQAIGFNQPKDHPDKYSRDSHQLPNATLFADGFNISLEIHHDAIARDTRGNLYYDEDIGLSEVTWRELKIPILSHEMMLHQLCRHLEGWHPGSFLKLINVVDVIRYSQIFVHEIDWKIITSKYSHVLNTLRCLHLLVALPLPLRNLLGELDESEISGVGEIAMSFYDIVNSHDSILTKIRSALCPPDWWLHLFYEVAPGDSLTRVKYLRHPATLLVMVMRRIRSRIQGG